MGASSYKAAAAKCYRKRKKILSSFQKKSASKKETDHQASADFPLALLIDKGYINQEEQEQLQAIGHSFYLYLLNFGTYASSAWTPFRPALCSFSNINSIAEQAERALLYLKNPLQKNNFFRTFMHVLFIHHDTNTLMNMINNPCAKHDLKYFLDLLLKRKRA